MSRLEGAQHTIEPSVASQSSPLSALGGRSHQDSNIADSHYVPWASFRKSVFSTSADSFNPQHEPVLPSSTARIVSNHGLSSAQSEPRGFAKVRKALLAALPCQDDIRILLTRITNVSAL